DIVGFPGALDIIFAKSDIAARGGAPDDIPIADFQRGVRPVLRTSEEVFRAVRSHEPEGAGVYFCHGVEPTAGDERGRNELHRVISTAGGGGFEMWRTPFANNLMAWK